MVLLYIVCQISQGVCYKKPNVIVIVADDLGWNDVGFHGSNQIPTPNIDALAYSGVILQNYYTLPLCTPSRSSLMTGLHPINTGMQHRVLYADEPWGLPIDIKILPQYLKDDGYSTHAVGKWHLGHFKGSYTPQSRGFDSHYGYWTGRQDYYDHTAQERNIYWGYDMREDLNVSWDSFGKYSTDLFTDRAVNIIDQHDNSRPLFLYLAHLAVHSANQYQPLQAPAEIIRRFNYINDTNRRIYAAMLWKLDESIGKVVQALSENDMLRNSIIIFTTDNGGPAAGFNLNAGSNWPLRGVKDTLWEGGVRGCSFIWSPLLTRSRVVHSLMHIQDWLPTILAATRSSSLRNRLFLDGYDMWPTLQGKSGPQYDEIILNIDQIRNISALRKGDWKIISGSTYDGQWDAWYGPSGRDSEYRYSLSSVKESLVARAFSNSRISFPDDEVIMRLRSEATVSCQEPELDGDPTTACNLSSKEFCLFNIANDPCERVNLANRRTDVLRVMLETLDQYDPVQPLNKPGDPAANPKFWNYAWTNWKDYI